MSEHRILKNPDGQVKKGSFLFIPNLAYRTIYTHAHARTFMIV